MCGIIGYIGKGNAGSIILEGLKKLEYRGYDSAGIAVLGENGLEIKKEAGKLAEIEKKHDFSSMKGSLGIGHTRWATHGIPNDVNAHPHADCTGNIVLVHNGIIENYSELKERLKKKGHTFASDTDSEVIAHLIEEQIDSGADTKEAIRKTLLEIDGSYALAILRKGENKVYAVRKSSPLIIGVGKGEMFVASDVPAILEHTREVIYVNDGELVELLADGCSIEEAKTGKKVIRKSVKVDWSADMARKDGYEHFMLKEIMEQHTSLRNTLNAEVKQASELIKRMPNILVVACGSSFHAGLVFKSAVQKHMKKRCDAVLGSEFAYGTIVDKDTVVVAISQSGETADTLTAVREAKKRGAKVIGVTNVVGSSLSRESDATVYIAAGPEISVVATKTFTSQIAVLLKLAYTASGKTTELSEMKDLADTIEKILSKREEIEILAKKLVKEKDFFFIGRGNSYPVAMEGALKLKEITYLHAEAYAGGELKHGPLSLLESGIPVIAIAPSDESISKMRGNIKECTARKAKIIALSDDVDVLKEAEAGFSFAMPKMKGDFAPMLYIIPLQLLAYYMAVLQKKDPDKPRNLAKSVTVE